MKKLYQVLSAVLLVASLFSCKEDTPFNGTDNRLLSLSLTASGQEYKGVITAENNIHITVPIDLDLNNAQAVYVISEQAHILPDPAKITDWNNEQVFNVISYDGEKRTYVVRIIRQTETAAGDVLLATDEEVKAFAGKGISTVSGNLIIGREAGTDSVNNIDALTYLTKVDYTIIVNPTYKGRDLSGLRNVTEIGGLQMNGNKFIQSLTLKSLKTVYEDLVVQSDTVKEIHLPLLTEVRGHIDIQANGVTGLDFPELQKAGGISLKGNRLSMLKAKKMDEVAGRFTLENLPSLETVDVSKLRAIAGECKVNKLTTLGTLSLPVLKTVNGNFTLENSPGIAECYLPLLEQTKGFRLCNNTKLSRLFAPKIKEVDGDFLFQGSPIKNLDQVVVETITGKLSLSNLMGLQSIRSFFQSVQKAQALELSYLLTNGSLDLSGITFEKLDINHCSNLSEIVLPEELNSFTLKGQPSFRQEQIPVIKGLKKVGNFSLIDIVTKNVSDYTISDLEMVTNNISIKLANIHTLKMSALKSVKGAFSLPCVTSVYQYNHSGEVSVGLVVCPLLEMANSLYIDSPDLERVDFQKLTTVDKLQIVSYYPVNNNSKLTDLNGLSALNHVRSLETKNLKVFTDYSFLKTVVENGALQEIKATGNAYNPTLEDLQEGKYVKP